MEASHQQFLIEADEELIQLLLLRTNENDETTTPTVIIGSADARSRAGVTLPLGLLRFVL